MRTLIFFFSSRRRHTRWPRDWSSDVCSSDLLHLKPHVALYVGGMGSATDNFHRNAIARLGWEEECEEIAERYREEIGRASCRERVEGGVGGGGVKKKEHEKGTSP